MVAPNGTLAERVGVIASMGEDRAGVPTRVTGGLEQHRVRQVALGGWHAMVLVD